MPGVDVAGTLVRVTMLDHHGAVIRTLPHPLDPVATAQRLAGLGRPWFWLEYARGAEPAGAPTEREHRLGVASAIVSVTPGHEDEFVAELRATAGPEGGGWVVAFGYEYGVSLLGLSPFGVSGTHAPQGRAAHASAPNAFALRADAVLVVDDATGLARLHAATEADADDWLARHGERLVPSGAGSAPPGVPNARGAESHFAQQNSRAKWRLSDEEYLLLVERCRAAIADGDAYVLCLTDTAEVARVRVAPIDVYLHLRERGPAARGGVIEMPGRALVSASPERFLEVSRVDASATGAGYRVATHPIKGTRPRGQTREHDTALAAELRSDPKEHAENLMIVDLMRNDLSRVCVPGSVRVDAFQHVESHPHVHQLVSSVSGRLRPERDVFDAIVATFPGGSMTGAPKRRAVELLRAWEAGPRGLYSGCFGWIGDDGQASLAMTIRGIELREAGKPGEFTALVGAGGGITWESNPDFELAEKKLKAASLLAALDRAIQQ